jgi:putative addiction module component (TIGR02574 family)
MSKEQLLAEILQLPPQDRHELIQEAIDSLPEGYSIDPDMTPELRAELDRRYKEMLEHPGNEITLDELKERVESKFGFRRS